MIRYPCLIKDEDNRILVGDQQQAHEGEAVVPYIPITGDRTDMSLAKLSPPFMKVIDGFKIL